MSRQDAINAMCKQCLYDPKATGLGGWRDQVEACTSGKQLMAQMRAEGKL